jgi:hypothetical protein
MESHCCLLIVKTREEFINALNKIKSHIIYNSVNPIIHIEMHGSTNGLETTNGETISWDELQPIFTEMNVICENNLFLTLATCYGGYIYKAISPRIRTPFWGLVGPFEEVNSGEILADFTSFYEEFIDSTDFNLAEKALNESNERLRSKFKFQNTEFVFNKAYDNYEAKYLTPEMVEHRINTLYSQIKHLDEFQNWQESDIKNHLKKLMLDEKDQRKQELMSKFLLWDLFPSHAQRT